MRFYWFKIALGALVIFAVGMLIRAGIRSARERVQDIAEGNGPITIPLPFGIMPFRLDGDRLGTVERLTLLRDTTQGISGIRVAVKLADTVAPERFQQCLVVLRDPEHLNGSPDFWCERADTTGLQLVHFGSVELEGLDVNFPLLIPEGAAADMRSSSATDRFEAQAESLSEAADAFEDSMDALADSIAKVNLGVADSIRKDANLRADSIRKAALEMADSIRRLRLGGHPAQSAPSPPPTPRP